MLKKIHEGRVESDEGFSIHLTGLEELKYEDKNFSILLEWNFDPTSGKTYVFVSDCKDISENQKDRIKRNIQEAVKLLKGNYEVI